MGRRGKRVGYMVHMNYLPAVSNLTLYANGEPIDGGIVLHDNDEVNIDVKLTLSNLSFIKQPQDETIIEPLFLYLMHYTQRGQRDIVLHHIEEYPLTVDKLSQDTVEIQYNIGKFNKPFIFSGEDYEFKYDLIENILFFKVLCSKSRMDSDNEIIFDSDAPLLLNIKVPMVMQDGK